MKNLIFKSVVILFLCLNISHASQHKQKHYPMENPSKVMDKQVAQLAADLTNMFNYTCDTITALYKDRESGKIILQCNNNSYRYMIVKGGDLWFSIPLI